MTIKKTLETGAVPVKIWTDDVDEASLRQLGNIAQLPFVHAHVAAMPDVHVGIGATVGSVIATRYAIVPAAVGVDIGCGMCAARTTLNARDLDAATLKRVFDQISRDVPVGRGQHREDRAPADAAARFGEGLTRILGKPARSPAAVSARRTGSTSSARSAAAITSSKSAPMKPIRSG